MSVPINARHALIAADRLAGMTWREIADKYGYASAESAQGTFSAHRSRSQDEPMRRLLQRVGQGMSMP